MAQNDRDLARPNRAATVSNADVTQLLRNLLDLVDESGDRAPGAFELLVQIMNNTMIPRVYTQPPVVIDDTGIKASTKLINCPPDKRISIFDLYISLEGITNIKFEYESGTDALAPMYAPNAGQGFVRNYPGGIVLNKGESLFYTNSAAVNFGIEINYTLI